jgi:hypothetical protein
VSRVTDFDTFVGSSPIHIRNNTPPNYAASFSVPPQNVDYDLGSTFGVEKLAFWNYPFMDPGGVTAFEVYTSEVSDFSSSFFAGVFTPINDGNGDINVVQVFDLADSNARFVRLRITGSAGGVGFGFSEVAFGVAGPATVVPEPSSLALLLAGAVGLAGVSLRRWWKQDPRNTGGAEQAAAADRGRERRRGGAARFCGERGRYLRGRRVVRDGAVHGTVSLLIGSEPC